MPTSKRVKSDVSSGDPLSELAAADRRWSVDKAISALAHEMAQPLASIANYANACARLLKAGSASREVLIDALQQTAAEALWANEVIRRAQARSAHPDSCRVRAPVNELVREVVRAHQAEIEVHEIKVSLRLADDLPVVVVDRTQIQLVLSHLIRNAIEAMSGIPAEQRSLTIETLAAGDAVSVQVADSGPTIDAAILAKMFEPYFTTQPGGLGLGLSVCQALVKAHGGRLGAQANSNSGLTVQFTLPISEK